jgi:hypothetical protein
VPCRALAREILGERSEPQRMASFGVASTGIRVRPRFRYRPPSHAVKNLFQVSPKSLPSSFSSLFNAAKFSNLADEDTYLGAALAPLESGVVSLRRDFRGYLFRDRLSIHTGTLRNELSI